ncbi:hypothetical protein RRG08_035215 [Elysia crispata]|uniref:Uncharacterized protein n=1 Tax=Elysia crispata TaxID=231223 RepID=A0AAE0ZMG0_9GAST|nr:hypothetical protein RRG08_035215 [Elysia crispata]
MYFLTSSSDKLRSQLPILWLKGSIIQSKVHLSTRHVSSLISIANTLACNSPMLASTVAKRSGYSLDKLVNISIANTLACNSPMLASTVAKRSGYSLDKLVIY